jgi:galacturonokinase
MPDYRVLIAFSGLRQALVGTDYNRRVEECTAAARTLLTACGKSAVEPLLGNISPAEYQIHRDALGDRREALRAAHFFTEVDRVAQGVKAWRRGDLNAFGKLMTASGWSSIHQYECGSPPLIDLYEILVDTPGVYGARFSGAGFRGCCVGLVEAEVADRAAQIVRERYQRKQPELSAEAPVLLSASADGAHLVD